MVMVVVVVVVMMCINVRTRLSWAVPRCTHAHLPARMPTHGLLGARTPALRFGTYEPEIERNDDYGLAKQPNTFSSVRPCVALPFPSCAALY